MGPEWRDASGIEDPHRDLEWALIEEFLRTRGHEFVSVCSLQEPQRTELLTAASWYAATRLAEVEARAHYLHEIHTEH